MSLFEAFDGPIHALVSGASRGIGMAIVDRLLAQSQLVRVIAAARRASTCAGLITRVQSADGRLALVDMDVTDEASVASAAELVGRVSGEIQLLINCVGVLHAPAGPDGRGLAPERRLRDVDPAQLVHSFTVNAVGPLLVAKHFAPLLPTRAHAVLANLSARVGSIEDNRLGGWYAYRAAKAAQNMFTRTLSIELRRRSRGLICVALHPGTVDTELSAPFQAGLPTGRLFSTQRAAEQLLGVVGSLRSADNGRFLAWDGTPISW